MTLKYYLTTLRKRWLALVISIAFGGIAAFGITLTMTPTYTAVATSFVALSGSGTSPTSLYQDSQFAQNQVVSYASVIHSPQVLEPVIKSLHLNMTTTELGNHVSATNPVDTVLLVIQATSGSATQAQAIANAVSTRAATVIESIEAGHQGTSKSPVTVSMLVPAHRPTSATSPRPELNVALGLLLGLAAGVVIAVLKEQFDTRVKSADILRDLTGASPLGTVRYDSSFRTQPLAALHAIGRSLDDFRSIRSTMQFVNIDNPPRQIVITSAIPNEGKSVVACNLALTLAQSDLSVCLVEADLRLPSVATYFGIDGSLGVTDVVAGHFSIDDVIVPWHRGELTIVPAGATPPDPGQILGSQAMDGFLAKLRDRFDIVIIDAPPLLPVRDAAVVGVISDGVIMVARYGHVRREQIAKAVAGLHSAKVDLLGFVLTHVPAKEQAKQYGGGDYGHAYGGNPRVSSHVVGARASLGYDAAKVHAARGADESRKIGQGADRADPTT